MSDPNDINAAMMRASKRAAVRRESERDEAPDLVRQRQDAPTAGAVAGGERLRLDPREMRYALEGRHVARGDAIELYTNRVNGWLRGRFAWTGRREDPPRLVVSVWDPHGARDAEGRPPFAGDLEIPIPAAAVCRFPRVAGDTAGVSG